MARYDAAIIDLDGTVYQGGTPIPGSAEGIAELRDAGVATLFLTNRATRTRAEVRETLAAAGIAADEEEILTSGSITAGYLAGRAERAWLMGPDALRRELEEAGVAVVDDAASADTAVVSVDPDLSYGDLTDLLRGADRDTRLVGTNPDETVPEEDGPVPGAGTVIGAVERMLGREVTVAGKPSEITVRVAMERVGADPGDCLMVGDRLNTDIAMAAAAGMDAALVLTGSTDRADLDGSDVQPEHVLERLGDIGTVLGNR